MAIGFEAKVSELREKSFSMSVIMILIIDGMIGEGKNLSESRPAIIHFRADL
jgi:hypothetical protein